ncbi:response regulator transcription factor [Allokutzneria albata]|uniref:response regulator transcription factor n=1 Tax=Allokutzneria albata TaxID=211114 RepID=UPI0009DD0539|nr:LuxR C-terminal-related transcriptional regulator [Allokutzneria albata]
MPRDQSRLPRIHARSPCVKSATAARREREVLELLAQCLSNADTAGRLSTSEATVKSQMTKLLGKLECANRVQAAILAHEAGLG